MKQVAHSLKSHVVMLEDVPAPCCRPHGVLVATAASFISSGTERELLRRGGAGLVRQALGRPDLVRQMLRRVRWNGVAQAAATLRSRLDVPSPLGYSTAGVVMEVGAGASGFCAGDRVACAGAGLATHAAVNWSPENLTVKIPRELRFEEAASVALGSIAMQGVRVAGISVAERVAVVGLGMVGLLTGQILKAAGCHVAGIDPNRERVRRALDSGFDDAYASPLVRERLHSGSPFDAVILTAATRSRQPVELAGELARDRAVVVVVGDVRVDVPRELYYKKELQIRYSRSYGPGRYDRDYEDEGRDYPAGYVRWTEQRNMEAYLALVAAGKVRVEPLITHRFPIDQAERAYDVLTGRTREEHLGIVLMYPRAAIDEKKVYVIERRSERRVPRAGDRRLGVGWIGAGSFSRSILLPALRRVDGIRLVAVANASGISAKTAARRFGFESCTADADQILSDPAIDAVFIATRHHLHASLAAAALESGKHVFLEKPLGVSEEEIDRIRQAYDSSSHILAVGFNRRFSRSGRQALEWLSGRHEPLSVFYRVNWPSLPPGHWALDPAQGHGRIIGEVCHFVDFIQFVTQALPARVQAWPMAGSTSQVEENFEARLEMTDGSSASLTCMSRAAPTLPKERIEIHGDGRTVIIDDFRRCELYDSRRRVRRWLQQDKGHAAEMRAFIQAIRQGGAPPIPFASLAATTRATLMIRESLLTGQPESCLESELDAG